MDVFGEKPDKAEAPAEEPKSYLSKFVEEGKSLEEVAEGLAKKAVHADEFIETLKNEKATLQSSFDQLSVKAKTMDELLEAIAKAPAQPHTPAPTVEEEQEDLPVKTSSMTEEDWEKKIDSYLNKKEKLNEVNQRFWETVTTGLGCSREQAKEVIFAYVNGDATKQTIVSTLGATDPEALVKILSDKKEEVNLAEPPVKPSAVPVVPTEEVLTWSYVKKLRKENPVKANSFGFKAKLVEAVRTNPNFYNT